MNIGLLYQQRRCSPMTLVSGNIRFMGYSREFPEQVASNDSGVVEVGNFQYFRSVFLQIL